MLNKISGQASDLPNIVKMLQNVDDPTDVIIFLDYDDCLEPSTQRNLTEEQKQILWDLCALTNGGVIITTNSDGRTVERILRGFPIISEFSTVFKNISDEYRALYKNHKPNCTAAFEIACAYAQEKNINLTEDAADLQEGAAPSIKAELKEMGLCFVFGQHAGMKEAAERMAQAAWKTGIFDREKFEIEIGKDAVEIKVKGAAKADIIDDIQRYLHFAHLKDRKVLVAMGDSGSDLGLMRRTGRGVVVGDSIKDDQLVDVNYIRLSSDNNDFSASWGLLARLREAWQSRLRLKVAHAPAAQ